MANQIERGEPLTEMVKGSMDYTLHTIRRQFYQAFRRLGDDWFWIVETFADHLIVEHESELQEGEFYRVAYTQEGETYRFAPRDQWQVVELAYQPRTTAMTEAAGSGKGKRTGQTTFKETITGSLQLVESEGETPNPDGPWRIQGLGITADVVNANGRRYASHVLEAAVHRLRTHLNESAGQGRLILTGEADHPNDKGNRTPLLTETIINWNDVAFEEGQVLVAGNLLGTQKGKDVRAQMKGGVKPDISQRAYGKSVSVQENGQTIEDVVELYLTGYDLVVGRSDPNAQVTMFESKQPEPEQPPKNKQKKVLSESEEDATMDELTLQELKKKYPQLVAQIESEQDEKRRKELELKLEARAAEDTRVAKEVAMQEAKLRKALGLSESDDLAAAVAANKAKLSQLEEASAADKKALDEYRKAEQVKAVGEHITEAVKALPYADDLKAILQEALAEAKPETVEAADTLLEAKRQEYDKLMAAQTLKSKGFNGDIQVLGPVFESQTGLPAYARPAFEITESLVKARQATRRDLSKPQTVNEQFAAEYLARFDEQHKHHLISEAQAFEEAEIATDLSLPYSVSRAVAAEAIPNLVATSVFDVAMAEGSPMNIYFEQYTPETGAVVAITDEAVTIVALAT